MLTKIIQFIKNQREPDSAGEDSVDSFRINKFRQVGIATYACLIFVSIHFFYIEKYETVYALGVIFALITLCFALAKHQSLELGAGLFLTMLTLSCCYFMWRHEGIADEALLVFPGLLIFAAVIANFKFSVFLLLIMLTNVFAIGYVNDAGIYNNAPLKSSMNSALVIASILVLITFSVSFLAGELHQLLVKLNRENRRVKKSQKEIERLLNHDALTGLPNRVLAKEFFSQQVELNARAGHKTALLFIDMDDFKSINDSLGHSVGDEYLKALSDKLRHELRGSDTLCRVAGDEFIIIAEHKVDCNNDGVLAQRILDSLKRPISLPLPCEAEELQTTHTGNSHDSAANKIALSASIGIAVYPNDGESFEALCNNADLAMYKAKSAGRNNYCYFNPDMFTDNSQQLAIAQALRSAIKNNELAVYYQTKQCLTSGHVTGAEALLRWNSKKLGRVSPVDFIPIAERSGIICDIGEWVLDNAIKTCKVWQQLGHTEMSISVNISSIQLKRGNFELIVLKTLEKHNLAGRFLVLELTESILFDMHENLSDTIAAIRSAGVRLAIDDFGTGYSNLGYLKKLDISMLKIDRSFISKINTSEHDLAIVSAIIQIANSLSIECVAEGIETEDVAQTMQKLKCDLGQGYFWNKPMDAEQFSDLLRERAEIHGGGACPLEHDKTEHNSGEHDVGRA